MYRTGPSFFGIAYIIIGIIVAANFGYLTGLSSLSNLLSAFLAVLAWPALFFGANLHLNFGV